MALPVCGRPLRSGAKQADFLVTGDKYLLDIGEFRGIPIVSPREFLDRLLEDVP
jgi:predicted nucleic acid-binding protein